ncbi:ester cyclase [Nonomuraea guangzhouensis]|uniref:Ester cyclase n=1 Tax=Nonomuraea guangzhouensis TaxID=1291555 RepID=A0ABW4GBY1_9ACTN|nr:ester cyclase [Nonomuraea guangzhouensis]
MTATVILREAREALVHAHFESEVRQDFDATLATMDHPRYELVGTGETFDGAEAVLAYHRRSRTSFPDLRHDRVRLHHAADAVIAEFELLGTHLGDLFGIPPTGKTFRVPMVAFFFFDGEDGDLITCERIYFDSASIATQLGILPGPAL